MSRKLPALNDDNCQFWQGGEHNHLLIHYCNDCNHYFHPPAAICQRCNSFQVEAKAVSGRGHIVSFTVNYQPWAKDLEVPYIIAIIELEEQAGLRLVSNIVGTDPEQVAIDQAVKVHFVQHEDVWIPQFEVVL